MSDEWQVSKGSGWIVVPGFGQLAPRRDNVTGGRQYFTWMFENDEVAAVTGETITEGPETFHFEFDHAFFVKALDGRCLEVEISLLPGGSYAVKYRDGVWPSGSTGGW